MFILYDEKLRKIEFPEGIVPLDIFIGSIGKTRHSSRIDGSDRMIEYGSNYDTRSISLEILLQSHDTQDYRLQRDEVYKMFSSKSKMYVSESYQPGKAYSMVVTDVFIPERVPSNQTHATATIECAKVETPFAESIGSTLDIIKHGGIHYNDELWGYGMGLSYDRREHKYEYSSRAFEIMNPGVRICPFELDLKIEIDNVSKGYRLENLTTGSKLEYYGDLSGKMTIDGASISINGVNVFRNTNRQFITLDSGINKILQNREQKVRFLFKFYYD